MRKKNRIRLSSTFVAKLLFALFIVCEFLITPACENKIVMVPANGVQTGGQIVKCDTTNITYTNTMQLIINANCAFSPTCHAAGSAQPHYDTYAHLLPYAQGGQSSAMYWYVFVQHLMPKPPQAPLDSCQMAQFKAWLNDGAPQ